MCKLFSSSREFMKSHGLRLAMPWVKELIRIAETAERESWEVDTDDAGVARETTAEWLKKQLQH